MGLRNLTMMMKPAKFNGHINGKVGMAKMEKVMSEFKHDLLHSGSKKGPLVTSRKQAIAIGMSAAGLSKKKKGRR